MRVKLQRMWYDGFKRHRVGETEVPDDTDNLPSDAEIWDGKNWVSREEREDIDFSALEGTSPRKGVKQTAKASMIQQAGATPAEKDLAQSRLTQGLDAKVEADKKNIVTAKPVLPPTDNVDSTKRVETAKTDVEKKKEVEFEESNVKGQRDLASADAGKKVDVKITGTKL